MKVTQYWRCLFCNEVVEGHSEGISEQEIEAVKRTGRVFRNDAFYATRAHECPIAPESKIQIGQLVFVGLRIFDE